MAQVLIGFAPSRELYDAVDAAIKQAVGDAVPEGLIVHTASELPDGRVQIVDVWESSEAATAFEENQLFPAFAKAGVPEEVIAASRPDRLEPFEVQR